MPDRSLCIPLLHPSVSVLTVISLVAGVADGVGGWALCGVDSGEYSRLLMQMAQLFAESKKLDPHPKQVLM